MSSDFLRLGRLGLGPAAALAVALLCAAAEGFAEGRAEAAGRPPSRIAFGSCAQQRAAQPVWGVMLETARPDVFVFCGDNIYAGGKDGRSFARGYERLAAQEGFAALRARVPVLATWDDHDYGPNDSGAENPLKEEAKRAFMGFFGTPPDSPLRSREGVYDSVMFEGGGRRLQVVLLDTRWFRSPLRVLPPEERRAPGKYGPSEDESATVLGAAQWEWLEGELRKPADLRVIVSSIQFVADEHGFEKWGNFPREKARMLELLRRTRPGAVVVISGDRHFAEISALPPWESGLRNPLVDVTSSGLNQGGSLYKEPNRNRIGGPEGYGLPNFGLIELDWAGENPRVEITIRAAETGEAVLRHETTLRDLAVE